MCTRKLMTLGCLVVAGLVLGAGAQPATAQYYSYYYPAPVYVAPAPVYVPPPVVYAPPPVYYAAPRVVYSAPVYRSYSFGYCHRAYPYHGHHRSFSFGFGYRRH